MIVDCDRCIVRGDACAECVITVLLGAPPGVLELDGADHRALDTLAAAGMVPRLQLVECDGEYTDTDHSQNEGAARQTTGAHFVRQYAERPTLHAKRMDRHVG